MLKLMKEFYKGIMSMPMPWPIWAMLLVLVNIVGSAVFIKHPEAVVVLLAIMMNAVIMMTLFSKLGFVRLLGLGHIFWVPLVPWLWSRLGEIGTDSLFGKWILMVVVIDGISLVIDAVDVMRYIRGERTPLTS